MKQTTGKSFSLRADALSNEMLIQEMLDNNTPMGILMERVLDHAEQDFEQAKWLKSADLTTQLLHLIGNRGELIHYEGENRNRVNRALRRAFNFADKLIAERKSAQPEVTSSSQLYPRFASVAAELAYSALHASEENFGDFSEETTLRHTRVHEVMREFSKIAESCSFGNAVEALTKRELRRNTADTYSALKRATAKLFAKAIAELRAHHALPLYKATAIHKLVVDEPIGKMVSMTMYQQHVRLRLDLELTPDNQGVATNYPVVDSNELAELVARTYWTARQGRLYMTDLVGNPAKYVTGWLGDEVGAIATISIEAGLVMLYNDRSGLRLSTKPFRGELYQPWSDEALGATAREQQILAAVQEPGKMLMVESAGLTRRQLLSKLEKELGADVRTFQFTAEPAEEDGHFLFDDKGGLEFRMSFIVRAVRDAINAPNKQVVIMLEGIERLPNETRAAYLRKFACGNSIDLKNGVTLTVPGNFHFAAVGGYGDFERWQFENPERWTVVKVPVMNYDRSRYLVSAVDALLK